MRGSWFRVVTVAVGVAGALSLVTACGSLEDDLEAPDGSTIVVTPESVSWDVPAGGLPGESTIQIFSIVVRDIEDRPLNDVQVKLTLSLAPTVSTPNIYSTAFLNDSCTDPASCIASGGVIASPEITRMTDDNGVVKVKVLVRFDGEFRDKLEVRSGTAFSSVSIEVSEA